MKIIRACLCAIAISALAVSSASATETLAQKLDELFTAPAWNNAYWGVMVTDLTTSKTLYEREAGKGFAPASNMKLYTTAAAMYHLGPDFRWQTGLYANGQVRNGVLRGDLIIKGSGDPSISWRYNLDSDTTAVLAQWADAIRKAGIKRIEGSVIGDDNVFDDEDRAGSWCVEYLGEWYAAEATGLAINENCWDVVLKPGKSAGAKASIRQMIPTSYYKIDNQVVTTGPKTKPDEEPALEISRKTDSNEIVLSGTIPVDLAEYREWGSLHNGTLYAATLLAEELQRKGVKVTRGARDIDDLPAEKAAWKVSDAKLLHTHQSPPLSKIIAVINKPSQNFYAEQLLKTVAAMKYGKGTYSRGQRAVRDFLSAAGVDPSGFELSDGSGLSRYNLVQPRYTLALLAFMRQQPYFQAFYDSLPIAGVDGTIRSRMKGTSAANNVHAKTGYIGRVRALSGYAKASNGHDLAFTMMVNNYTVPTSQANTVQDKAAVLMIETATE